ncbi:MAG: metallophosphoesterase family protein [Anaerolineae bacterium]
MVKNITSTMVRLPARRDRPARVGVIANTYGVMPDPVADALAGVDLILHAGDIGEISVITRLQAIAPVFAVIGDLDSRTNRLPLHRLLKIGGKTIILTHGHDVRSVTGTLRGWIGADRSAEAHHEQYMTLLRAFPPADCIVFAHPGAACRIQHEHTLIMNPGAVATSAGVVIAAGPSIAVLELGRVIDGVVLQLGQGAVGAARMAAATP